MEQFTESFMADSRLVSRAEVAMLRGKQYVWGLSYIDELVQVAINQDPENASYAISGGATENECERFFWACTDANYNVLGLIGGSADATNIGVGHWYLAERYEYTVV